jgi:hypothetical protein
MAFLSKTKALLCFPVSSIWTNLFSVLPICFGNVPASPANLPEMETELEVPNSCKIPVRVRICGKNNDETNSTQSSLRQDELTAIRKALHKMFTLRTRREHVWARIKHAPSSDTAL